MIYLHTTKPPLCFLHIPKTAGTWMRVAIRVSGVSYVEFEHRHEHATLDQAMKKFSDGVEYFTVVRHPFAWLRSYWVDRQLKGWGGDLAYGTRCQADDFETFVRLACKELPGYLTELYERYMGEQSLRGPVAEQDGSIFTVGVGARVHAIKTEQLPLALNHLMTSKVKAAGFRDHKVLSLLPLNVGASYPRFREETNGSPELWAAVCAAESRIYAAFNYEVEPPPRLAVSQL